MAALNNFAKELERRMLVSLQKYKPDSPEARRALTLIGIKLSTQTKRNIIKERLVDTGSLLNSIKYFLHQKPDATTLEVGSYGIPYAKILEFGYNGPMQIGPHSRTITKAFGRPIEPVVVGVAGHTRNVNVRPRKYLGKAFEGLKAEIVNILRGL